MNGECHIVDDDGQVTASWPAQLSDGHKCELHFSGANTPQWSSDPTLSIVPWAAIIGVIILVLIVWLINIYARPES